MMEVLLVGWVEVGPAREYLHVIRRAGSVVDVAATRDSSALLAELAARAPDDELVCTPELASAAGAQWRVEPWTDERKLERAVAAADAASRGAFVHVRDRDVIDKLLRATARVMTRARPPLVAPFDIEELVRQGIVSARRTAAGLLIVQDDGASLEVFPSERTRGPFLAALDAGDIEAARRRDRVTVQFGHAPEGLATAIAEHTGSTWVPVPSRWYDGDARPVTRDECMLLVTVLEAAAASVQET